MIDKHLKQCKKKGEPTNGKRRKLTEAPARSFFIKHDSKIILDYSFLDTICEDDDIQDPMFDELME